MARIDDMTQGSPARLLVRFALPMMLGYAFQFAYAIADGAVVGRLIGVSAFASVGATWFCYWLLLDIVMGLVQGFGTLLAQRFGARDMAGFRCAAGTAAVLTAITGVALTVLGVGLARPVLTLMGTPADILDGAVLYLRIMAGGMMLTAMNNLLAALLRSLGDSRTPLMAMIWSSLLNIGMAVALVLWTGWGIGAVAIATLTAQAFSLVYSALAMRRSPGAMPARGDWRIDRGAAIALLRLGAPGAFRNAVVSIGGLVVQSVVNSYGSAFVAGVALPNKIYGLMEIAGGALEGAVAVFVAQNYGARHVDRIAAGMRSARKLMLISSTSIALLLLLIGRPLMALMVGSEGTQAVLDIAQRQMCVMLAALPCLYLLCSYRAAVQGMGNATVPMVSGFVELGVRLICVLVLARIWGEWGAYLAVSAGWPAAMLVVLIAYRREIARATIRSSGRPIC